MTKVFLLEQLKEFTEAHVKDLLLPVQAQEEDETPPDRPAAVYIPRLPEQRSYERRAPFITHEIITGRFALETDRRGLRQLRSAAVVRTVFCVYHENEAEGGLALMNLMERVSMPLLERVVIGKQFKLDLDAGVDALIYPIDPGKNAVSPFYFGEMLTTWILPPVERIIDYGGKKQYSNIRSSGPEAACGQPCDGRFLPGEN